MAVKASTQYVKWLDSFGEEAASEVGGKALGLAKLLGRGFSVPPGFVVTTDAYTRALETAHLGPAIDGLIDGADPTTDNGELSRRIVALFDEAILGEEIAGEIAEGYARLSGGGDVPVAVRSSATAEDTAEASFAGQQDTYLWVQGADEVRRHVVRCWASLFTARAISYRLRFGVPAEGLAMGVVVQQMVPADTAGVMMTLEPVTGDRTQIYIEAAYGLGEGVVRGDVGSDRYWVGKADLAVAKQEINLKAAAHRFDEAVGLVVLTDVPAAEQGLPALDEGEAIEIAQLGRRIEAAFGAPMDIEWAASGPSGSREVFLLQARPETVWSRDDDPLQSDVGDDRHWSTDNAGEAMPGVLTPLTWTTWGPLGNQGGRDVAFHLGVLSRVEREDQSSDGRMLEIFYGRAAMQMEYVGLLGDRLPGVSGREAVTGILGRVPEEMEFKPSRRRYPVIAWRLPVAAATAPRRLRAFAAETDTWWTSELRRLPALDCDRAVDAYEHAARHFGRVLTLHSLVLMSVIQPLYEGLSKIVDKAGVGDVGALSGSGGAEMAIVRDIWAASRGAISVEQVLLNHGFHGPQEGELSGRVWREDPTPLRRLVEDYSARSDADDPAIRERTARERLPELQREVLAALPRIQRPVARVILSLASTRIPLRGVGKRAFLQALDVCRAAARRAGVCMAEAGVLEDAEDVFYLTAEELRGAMPADVREVVSRRRARRKEYLALSIPASWKGVPTVAAPPADVGRSGDRFVSGIGVSAGVVEGVARVVTDPAFADVQPDEILVAPTTDPSWSSIMFISSGLVVDIGGALSHAAVVARELGLPCVVNTRDGTRRIKTGDRLRVDGSTGTVEICEEVAS